LEPFYKDRFGIIPNFKAGIHHGIVMAGEVGIIKKDIIYSGDILNTAARIQAKCNGYDVDFLISKTTLNIMNPKDLAAVEITDVGSVLLRGKKEELLLSSIHKKV
jgi:adenylate cyclase